MEFSRQSGQASTSQAWIDKNLPRCPLCNVPARWETATKVDQLAMERWHFQCPNCKAVLSTPPDITVSARVPPVTVVRKSIAKNLRIESTGKKSAQDLVGKEYPLAELQQWSQEKGS